MEKIPGPAVLQRLRTAKSESKRLLGAVREIEGQIAAAETALAALRARQPHLRPVRLAEARLDRLKAELAATEKSRQAALESEKETSR